VTVPEHPYVNSLATGASSLLAEATPNRTYLNYAQSSRDFYVGHLRNPLGDMLDGVHADSCVPGGGTFPANAGLMMEGLAVLMSVSKSDDVEQNLLEIVNKTVSNTGWHPSDGILQAGSKTQADAELVGQYIVRGLSAIYNRNKTKSSLRTYAREYLGVQARFYNAVLSNARGQGSDNSIYGANWAAPASPSNFSLQDQTNALSILIAAISIRDDTTEGPESPTPSHKPDIGAIAGGIIGGVVALMLLAIFVLWLVRRRRRTMPTSSESPVPSHIIPFTFTPEKANHWQGEKRTSDPPRDLEGARSLSTSRPNHTDAGLTGTSSQDSSRADSVISTAELVRLLNQRLQVQDWQEDEQPPDYASHGTPTRSPPTIVWK
ncbi:hypothetical protein V5O48_008789, partial [Marasmius crinis-equi]